MESMEGKIAIVTGAGSGIGRAVAQAFGREGAKVLCAAPRARRENERGRRTRPPALPIDPALR